MTGHSKKILILRLSSIGDILLTTPFIRQVRKTYPDAEIDYIVKKEFEPLLKHNPHITHLIPFDSSKKLKGLHELNRQLKEKNYNYIFDLHNNLRTNRLTQDLKGQKTRIKKNKIKRAALVYLKLNLYKGIKSIPEKYLDVGANAGVRDDGQGLELFLNEQNNVKELEKVGLTPNEFLCMAPGAAHFTKTWPLEYVSEIINRITDEENIKIAILGAKNERDLFAELPENENVIHLEGKLSLLESAAVLKNSLGIISNDSGLMHMASALNKPMVAVFGSTVKELGFFPFRSDSTIIENNNLWCRPCSHIGRKKCPLGHFKCMRDITVNHVFNEVKEKLVN